MFGFPWVSKKNKEQEISALKKEYIEGLDELVGRFNNQNGTRFIASNISGSYDMADTLHNIYCDFGYPTLVTFFNFWNMYRRFGPAKAVVNIPCDLGWLQPPMIKSSNAQFQREFELLAKETKLWNRLKGLDKRQRVGRYAGLFIEAADGKSPEEPLESLPGVAAVRNLKPIYEDQLRVTQTNQDPYSANFGNPEMYTYNSADIGNRNDRAATSFQIHPSRIIIAAEDADDGSIYGVSALECVYNDLMDLRKISGSGGEAFYQNSRNSPVIYAEDGYQAPNKKDKERLEEEIDSYLNKWRKKFVSKGLKFEYPNIRLDSPKEFAQNSWDNISAGSGIAGTFLKGNQTGRLAGEEDSQMTLTMIQSRRENFMTELVADVVDWMILHGALPSAEYEIEWDDLLAKSDDDKLESANKAAEVNQKAFASGLGAVFDENEIREIAGYEPATIEVPSEELPLDGDIIE